MCKTLSSFKRTKSAFQTWRLSLILIQRLKLAPKKPMRLSKNVDFEF